MMLPRDDETNSTKVNSVAPKSLVGQVLLRVTAWSTLLVMGVALAGYFVSYERARSNALGEVVQLAAERGDAAMAPLRQAMRQVDVFSAAFLDAYQNPAVGNPARFDEMFREDEAGALRLREEYFYGTTDERKLRVSGVSGFIGQERPPLDDELKRRLVILVDLVARFGPAWGHPVANTHVTVPENGLIMYWPEVPWGLDARSDLNVAAGGVVRATRPSLNPDRKPVWSALYYDYTAEQWTITYQKPVDLDGRHLANPSHDILLDDVIAKLAATAFPGGRTLLIGSNGEFIGDLATRGDTLAESGLLNVEDLEDPLPAKIFRQIKAAPQESPSLLDEPVNDNYVAVSRIEGPDWYFVALYPRELVRSEARQAAGLLLGVGLLLQLLLLLVLWSVMRRRVRQPVRQLKEAVSYISQHEYAPVIEGRVVLPEDEPNEIGELARTLRTMSRTIDKRQEELEAEVRSRTEKLAAANRELAAMSETDRLTNLPNRRALDKDIEALKRAGNIDSIAIAMLDIDHFKSFNDALGHSAGDDTLRQVAEIIAYQQRPDVRAYRYGGEEFCMIFTNPAVPHVPRILKGIVRRVRDTGITHPDSEAGVVTLSAGYASGNEAALIDEYLDAADQALYRAKRAGRGRVEGDA